MSKQTFVEKINQSYALKSASIHLGSGVLQGEIIADAKVHLSLKMMNRHGLVTGATGSGKTRTLLRQQSTATAAKTATDSSPLNPPAGLAGASRRSPLPAARVRTRSS